MIDGLQQELLAGGYNEDDALALAQIREVSETELGVLDAGKKLKLKAFADGLESSLQSFSTDETPVTVGNVTTTIGGLCRAAFGNLASETVDLELTDPETVAILDTLVDASVITVTERAIIEQLSQKTIKPFEFASLRDIAEARGRTNSQQIAWGGQKFLIIDVTEPPAETVRPFLTFNSTALGARPAGRTANIKQVAGKYVVDLQGLQYAAATGTVLNVEFYIPCTFSLSLY